MTIIYDYKYPVYSTVPNGTEIGVIKFSFNAPILVGDLASAIVNSVLPPAVSTQGGEIARVTVWRDQVNILINKWTTEVHIYFPQAALGKTGLFAFVPVLMAIWAAIQPYLGWIIGGIITSVILDKITTAVYGPVNPKTGNRESPSINTTIMIVAIIAVVGFGAYFVLKSPKARGLAYEYAKRHVSR